MIISRKYAKKLVREGKAEETGLTCEGHRWPEGDHLVVLNRFDLQRTDHYYAELADEERLTQGDRYE